jgi:hypothetical protein
VIEVMSLDSILKAQRSMQKALEGPMASYVEQQEKLQQAMEGPLASYLEREKQIRKALEGPLASYVARQEQMQKALEGPMATYLERQEQLQRAMEGPLASYLAREKQTRKALEGPMASYVEQQEKLQRAMEGPLASYLEGRTKFQRALEGPLASLLANQGAIRGGALQTLSDQEAAQRFLRDALEDVDEVEVTDDSPLLPWLAWTTVLPSVVQVRLALELLGIAIAVASCTQSMAGADIDPAIERVQACIGLLVALAGYLLRMAED